MERFWSKVCFPPDGDACWQWAGAISGGYGRFRHQGRTALAHRVAWELTNGSIPAGLVIDHLCRNRGCVNPEHMEVVTQGENIRRGDQPRQKAEQAAARVLCAHGHPWARFEGRVSTSGNRYCRECGRLRYHEKKAV